MPTPRSSPGGQAPLEGPPRAVRDGLNSNGAQRPSRSVALHLLTMRQAGQYLGVSYWTVRTWVESGKLRAVRLPGGGRLLRIEITELERLIAACRDG